MISDPTPVFSGIDGTGLHPDAIDDDNTRSRWLSPDTSCVPGRNQPFACNFENLYQKKVTLTKCFSCLTYVWITSEKGRWPGEGNQ